jgi:hypothetical protein
MARDRVNIGFGPTVLPTLTGTSVGSTVAAGTWVPWGPFKGTNFTAQVIFTSTVGKVKIQGTLTTASTKGVTSLTLISTTDADGRLVSTAAGSFAFIRALSTALSSGTAIPVCAVAI